MSTATKEADTVVVQQETKDDGDGEYVLFEFGHRG